MTGSFIYLNPALSFLKIPIRVVKPTLHAICSQFFPCPLCISYTLCLIPLSYCCAVLYAFCIISFSYRFPFRKGKTIGNKRETNRINDDATTFAERVAEDAWQCCPGWVISERSLKKKKEALAIACRGFFRTMRIVFWGGLPYFSILHFFLLSTPMSSGLRMGSSISLHMR